MSMPTIERELTTTYDAVLAQMPDVLKAEGFGVLTEIDVKQTLKAKIDEDFRRYTILGACNPTLAHQALQEDLNVGVLLPCNVVVYERDGGGTVVSAVDPVEAIGAFGDEAMRRVAAQVRSSLERVIEAIR